MRCTTPFPRPTDLTVWFCSELVVYALQLIGLCSDLEPCMTTPTMLFTYLRTKDCTINESVVLEKRIKEKGLKFTVIKKNNLVSEKKKKRLKFKKCKFNSQNNKK
jgi:hypothetical protein